MIDKWNKCTTIEHRRQTERGGAIMANKFKQENVGREELHQNEVHRPNLERLVAFAEEQDADGTLIPVFLAILEMCFQG